MTADSPTSSGEGEGPLLVVIDMQRLFGPGTPWATPGFDSLFQPIGRLVDGFGDRICFTRFVVPAHLEGSWVDYYREWEFATRPEAVALHELAAPLAERARGHLVVDKPSFCKMGPELRAAAGASETLVVCGVATDCCVIATVIDAADSGMHVRVVADACAGATAEAHERAVAIMAGFAPQVRITNVDDELALAAAG
ncbi:MAG TPA: cysteine hydrolase [Actinomycetota bacterium]